MRAAALFLAVGMLAVVPAGCGGGGGGDAISTQVMSGKIGGVPWSLVAGQTNVFLSSANPQRWVADMYDVPIDQPCFNSETPAGAMRSMILSVPRAVGHYSLSPALTATFVILATSKNNVAPTGTIEVIESTATTVRGGASITFDASNTVNGQFAFNVCPTTP